MKCSFHSMSAHWRQMQISQQQTLNKSFVRRPSVTLSEAHITTDKHCFFYMWHQLTCKTQVKCVENHPENPKSTREQWRQRKKTEALRKVAATSQAGHRAERDIAKGTQSWFSVTGQFSAGEHEKANKALLPSDLQQTGASVRSSDWSAWLLSLKAPVSSVNWKPNSLYLTSLIVYCCYYYYIIIFALYFRLIVNM